MHFVGKKSSLHKPIQSVLKFLNWLMHLAPRYTQWHWSWYLEARNSQPKEASRRYELDVHHCEYILGVYADVTLVPPVQLAYFKKMALSKCLANSVTNMAGILIYCVRLEAFTLKHSVH